MNHLFVYDYEDRWGWPELFRNEYIQKLLFERKKRMMQETQNGQPVRDDKVREELEMEKLSQDLLEPLQMVLH